MENLKINGLTTGIPVKEPREVSAEVPRHSGMQVSSQGPCDKPSDEALDRLNLRRTAVVPELHFKTHIPMGHWYRLRRKVMGRKPRIPRKIKKALKHPCTKSKWHHRAARFNNRQWKRYCERTMQPGQCRMLQARLLLYLTLNGCKHSWRNQTLKCEMPSGVKVAIYPKPKFFGCIGGRTVYWYGAALYPYRKYGRVRYISENTAMHMYKRLGEAIKNKVEQLDKEK